MIAIPTNRSLSPNDINIKKDVFLGETCVQIESFHDGYPSVHIVRSYMLKDSPERTEGGFYHIFKCISGTCVTNFKYKQYEQVKRHIDISDYWTILYLHEDNNGGILIPISKLNRLNDRVATR
ncbi:hypothetical protein ACIQD3_22100 [Peribacillus loiseleuriae]|uniref:hypothetical protein n=1 Tax=Peribacillus loiseleuriae TaxID=1679170 RepID=UPI00380C8CE8